jgi:SAM-dependent methyltransferase
MTAAPGRTDLAMHAVDTPSDWIRRWTHLVPAGAPVLDVACGGGRHLRWFREHGHAVTGIDRAPEAVQAASELGEAVAADLEGGGAWPLPGRQFGAVVVTNYLWRPLFPALQDSVAPGGVLLYETFALGNETVGRPARPEFLLAPGELLRLVDRLRIVGYEDGFAEHPPRFVQRIAAVRPAGEAAPRYPLP